MVSAIGLFTSEEMFIISKLRHLLELRRDQISVEDQIVLLQLGLLTEGPGVWDLFSDCDKYFGIPHKRYFVFRHPNKPGHLAEAERVLATLALPKDQVEKFRIAHSFELLIEKHWDSIPSFEKSLLLQVFLPVVPTPVAPAPKSFPRPVDYSDEESEEEDVVPVRKSWPRVVDSDDEAMD